MKWGKYLEKGKEGGENCHCASSSWCCGRRREEKRKAQEIRGKKRGGKKEKGNCDAHALSLLLRKDK